MVERLERGHAHLAQQLHDFAGVVSYAPPELALKLTRPLPTLARDLTAALKAVTGTAWQVRIAEGAEEPRRPFWSKSRTSAPGLSRKCSHRQW
jgi:DNA polymerase-3 subunit gamma/tau